MDFPCDFDVVLQLSLTYLSSAPACTTAAPTYRPRMSRLLGNALLRSLLPSYECRPVLDTSLTSSPVSPLQRPLPPPGLGSRGGYPVPKVRLNFNSPLNLHLLICKMGARKVSPTPFTSQGTAQRKCAQINRLGPKHTVGLGNLWSEALKSGN